MEEEKKRLDEEHLAWVELDEVHLEWVEFDEEQKEVHHVKKTWRRQCREECAVQRS